MKTLLNFTLFLFILSIFGCGNSDQKTGNGTVTDSAYHVKTDNSDSIRSAKPIENVVYVTNRDGIDSKELPKNESVTIVKLDYGDGLEVIKDTLDWLGVKVFTKDKKCKLGYIKKENTGPITEIKKGSKEQLPIHQNPH